MVASNLRGRVAIRGGGSGAAFRRRHHPFAREGGRQRRVAGRRYAARGYGELIDLANTDEESETPCRIAGRYNVHRLSTDDGAAADMIEILSDADDEGDDSNPPTVDLTNSSDERTSSRSSRLAHRRGVPPSSVDLARATGSGPQQLCEHEPIYVNLAQPSSSDDYESSESSDKSDSESDKHQEQDSDSDKPRVSIYRRRTVVASPPIDKKVLALKTFTDIVRLESCKPWRFVFRCLEIPFETTPRSDSCGFMFERWDEFWLAHGRAVWERMFWKPMHDGTAEYAERKYRQERAAKAFRVLAGDLHEKFGPKLLEVVQSKPHSGWWYRSNRPVDLVRLQCHDARLYALHLSRFRERWPVGVRHVRVHGNALWCLPDEEPKATTGDQPAPEMDVDMEDEDDSA